MAENEQKVLCLPCVRRAKERAKNVDNGLGPADNPVGEAITWEVTLTPEGFPLGPYPVCIEHVTVADRSPLLKG
jgi:hypothetical protein